MASSPGCLSTPALEGVAHDGRALVPIPERSTSPRVTFICRGQSKALDPKRPIREADMLSRFCDVCFMGVERVQTGTAYMERLPHQIGHVDFAQRGGEILLGNRECRQNDRADELRLRQQLVRLFDACQ